MYDDPTPGKQNFPAFSAVFCVNVYLINKFIIKEVNNFQMSYQGTIENSVQQSPVDTEHPDQLILI